MIAAIILAAGESTRMGSPKALLLDPRGRPFVARLARTFLAAGVSHVIVVTGSLHDEIRRILAEEDLGETVRLARNPNPARGQLSSLWVGLDAASELDPEAILMVPVDTPLVKESTVRLVVDAWRETTAAVVRPASGARHGHPVLFARSLFQELRRAPLDAGAKAVVRAHEADILNVQVDDEACLVDVDTPEDYERLMRM